jgi:hypothetical protein
MKTTLQIVGIILTLFMLGTPIITEASQPGYTASYASADKQAGYSTGIHNRSKKKQAPAPAPK